MELVSIVPVYNESGAIEKVIDDIDRVIKKEKIAHEIIVVDDGSTHNTAEIADLNSGFRALRKDIIMKYLGQVSRLFKNGKS